MTDHLGDPFEIALSRTGFIDNKGCMNLIKTPRVDELVDESMDSLWFEWWSRR